MALFRFASSPRRPASSELHHMWLSLMRGTWSSLAVVPADPSSSAKAVVEALEEVGRLHELGPFTVIDAEGASIPEGTRLASKVASVIAGGSRAVLAVDSPMHSLAAVTMLRDVDAALLVVRLGSSGMDFVQSTINIIPPGRILGTVALPRYVPTHPAEPPQRPAAKTDSSPEPTAGVLKVGRFTLVLNGAGTCKDSRGDDVYSVALYLSTSSSDPLAIVTAEEPKAIRMTFLQRVERGRLMAAFRKAVQNKPEARFVVVEARLNELEAVLPAEMTQGQVFSIVYVPGTGSSVGIEGGKSVRVEGRDLADALFGCWLSDHTDDPSLRDAMLGLVQP